MEAPEGSAEGQSEDEDAQVDHGDKETRLEQAGSSSGSNATTPDVSDDEDFDRQLECMQPS